MANRVFEDRLGVWIVNPANLPGRLDGLRELELVDVFLPRTATLADFALVRSAGLYAHLWSAPDGLAARDFADRFLADVARLRPGAGDLNIELPSDPPLAGYMLTVVDRIRRRRPSFRLRLNIAPWKAFALPVALLERDGALYVCEQAYAGDMSPFSPADALGDLLDYGVPRHKATVCYGAAGPVPGSSSRVCTLPILARSHRGVVFQDDLLAEVGLL